MNLKNCRKNHKYNLDGFKNTNKYLYSLSVHICILYVVNE